jgi:hypothetical protein
MANLRHSFSESWLSLAAKLVLASEAVEEWLHWWIALWQRLPCGSHHRRNRF